ncbi:N-Dimethylarginine dimethylaminohydrolase [Granulicella pectinivorans]|uniref:N-Dimethylarginine dimethylaminohydrolase n=1 Tax=Granulicella pectinivorans TaxID=474950 RepID=A0A1I6MDY6_9BACT|nr:arginine deiminase-related protein [Granulicella pectinivorans]SFS13808.1 N-Dimethylarginine dimethylaminohydrolase [Granulicella pectinivorans]
MQTFSTQIEIQLPNNSDETQTTTQFTRPTFLMCAPGWYELKYVINPWMAGNIAKSVRDTAFQQWNRLYEALRSLGDVRLLRAKEGSPDMTFVAHGAVVNYGVAALSSFAHYQRTAEEDYLEAWFEDAGFIVWKSEGLPLEGEGDALFSPDGNHLWAAHGSRTSLQSHRRLGNIWHVDVTSLHLVDPRFYHLDLCFTPLSGGHVLYYPGAFDRRSLRKIEDAYSPNNRIALSEVEAVQFACNVINVGDQVLMHTAGSAASRIRSAGYEVSEFPLGEFVKGGGAAKSLALRLSDVSVTHRHPSQRALVIR